MKTKIFTFIFIVLALTQADFCFAVECKNDLFLKELLSTEDDFRAVTILKEREFNFRGTKKGFECAGVLLGLYLRHEEFDVADNWLTRMTTHYPIELQKISTLPRLKAEMAYVFGNYTEADRRISAGAETDDAHTLRDFARAAHAPYQTQPITCLGSPCDQLRTVLDDTNSENLKNPNVALALGIIPGMGQVYAGRTLSGMASLLLNSVLIGTTIYGISRSEYAFAILSGAASTGIYLGSIYAGYESVKRHNEQLEAQKRTKIRNINIELKLLQLTF